MSPLNSKQEAEPRTNKWWLDQNPPVTQQSVPIAKSEPLMSFEEVALDSPEEPVSKINSATEHQANYSQENDRRDDEEQGEEDDLVVTEELTRVNSFDFVINQVREMEADAAMADLVQNSIRYEPWGIEAVHVRANGSVSRQGAPGRAPCFTEEIELRDLEAGRVRAPTRKETVKSQSTSSAMCKIM
ncbi:hypothetical protein BST61_g8880 [Cercospora zeina]